MRSPLLPTRWEAARRCFVDVASGRQLAGITEPLHSEFYPNYTPVRLQSASSGRRGGGRSVSGSRRGTLVDSEVAQAVNESRPPRHAYTRLLFSALARAGLTPLAAQVPVGDPGSALGTGVDLVCSRRGELYVLELKTGWNSVAYDLGSRRMRGLGSLQDSPRNQHLLQLLVTRYLFRATFGLQTCKAAVVRVSDDGVRFYKLSDSFLALEATVVRALAARVQAARAAARVV